MNPASRFFVALLTFSVLTGCTRGYMADRGRDAKDIFNLCIGYGFGAKVRAGPLHVGAIVHYEKGGLRGGKFHWAKDDYEYHSDIHLLLIGGDDFWPSNPLEDFAFPYAAYRPYFPEIRGDWDRAGARRKGYTTFHSIITLPYVYGGRGGDLNQIYSRAYYTQIDCVIGIGPSFRVGFNPGELVDFLLGFVGIDLYRDDLEKIKQEIEQASAGDPLTAAPEK